MTTINDDIAKPATMLIEAATMCRGRRPHARIGAMADDFNRLLQQSRAVHASSPLLARLQPLPRTAPLVALVTRVSVLKGVLDAAAES